MIEIVDQSNSDLYSQNQDLINNFTDYSSKNLDFDKPVKVYFMDDEENAKDPLGKTAHYNPDTLEIKIYVTGRHLKDILRSISHELIHHVQNCRGDFGSLDSTEAGYAQSNDHLRGMEQEAYTQGNIMNFRDFEDNYKRGTKTMSETKINKLKAMVREGVREVLSEQEVTPVATGGKFTLGARVNLERKTVNKIAKCADPKLVGQYISSQLNSAGINDEEFKLMLLGIKSCAEKQTLQEVPGGTSGQSQSRNLVSLLRAIKNYTTAFGTLQKSSKEQIIQIIENYEELAASYPPSEGIPQVDSCPDGTREDNQGRCLDSNNIVKAFIKSENKPAAIAQATTTGKAKRYKKEGCDKLPVGKGCQSDLVKEIQRHLGFKGSDIDGKFWTKTERAVIRFQENSGISPANGIVDQKTLEQLKFAARPERRPQVPAPAPAPAPATSVSKPKYAGVEPGSDLERALDNTPDINNVPKNKRSLFINTRVWSNRIGNSNYSPGSPKHELAKAIKAALLKKGYLEKVYNPNLTNESLTIEQKKLTEAKSLFERLKKVL